MRYIVYSHTDYLDILTVHTDYLKYDNNVLLLNKNDKNLEHIYSKYKEVIFYDDTLPYAGRLLNLFKQIKDEYFIFIHDIDVPIYIDMAKMDEVINYAVENNVDRMDLQHENYPIGDDSIFIDFENKTDIKFSDIGNYNLLLVRSYLYNVNPCIWKRASIIDILEKFSTETYRTIEKMAVSNYCKENYVFYKFYTKNVINTGYYNVTPVFMFFHITHGGYLMPYMANENKATLEINNEYIKILNKYGFNRPMRTHMH